MSSFQAGNVRRRFTRSASIAVAALLLAGATATGSGPDRPSVQDLAWLAGCWASVGGETGSGEQWSIPAGGTMFGISRTVRNSKTVAYEFLQIRQTEAGEIEYIARPSGQVGATFVLAKLAENEVVFENLDHDFPQRIIYRAQTSGLLEARIEGETAGGLKAVDFPMKRIACY